MSRFAVLWLAMGSVSACVTAQSSALSTARPLPPSAGPVSVSATRNPTGGEELGPRSYVCYKTTEPITIDGNLTEPSWQKARWTDLFVDIEGSRKPAPRLQTRVKLLWDDSYLYVATELEEPDVSAILTERDAVIFQDNDFEVFIDPDGDTHQYYELELNALNTVWDLLLIKPYRDGGPAVNSWDIRGLKTAVQVQGTLNQPGDKDKGWTAELAFPWSALKEYANRDSPPRAGDQWRMNFSRVEWKMEVKEGKYSKMVDPRTSKAYPEDNWVWSPQGLIDMHYPEMWGFVQFSEKSVGTGDDSFVFHPEEKAKWALRQIYYKERQYWSKHGRYTSNITALGLTAQKVDGYVWPPSIRITPSLYEATIESRDGREQWHISQDGRTWKK